MRIDANRHLDEDEIERYSLGTTADEDFARLDEHLLICESCQDRVTESDRYVSTMQRAGAQLRGRGSKQSRMVPIFALAATVLFLVVFGLRFTNRSTVAPAFALNLVATRGNGIEAKAPGGRPLTLQLDLAGLPPESSFGLEMVDRFGRQVWQGTVVSHDSKAAASVPQRAGGIYFVRVYAPSGALLREYGLEIEGR
ncbi:MAG: hypothetical protein LAQ69_19555 [Acidobacteriia bacterium]|nr:hypothetical protein [Terriglobia bacterium]